MRLAILIWTDLADLFVAGYRGCRLFRNSGEGRFAEVADASGLSQSRGWNVNGAWLDFDRDGDLDLFVITYCDWKLEAEKLCFTGGLRDCCSPKLYPGDQARLWRNRGDGTLEDVTSEAGLLAGRGLGLVSVDLNDDGWMDVFVANDVMENVLYLGGPQLPLVRAGLMAGVSYSPTGQAEGSMGADAGDFDGNGKPDLIYANYAREDNSLLKCIGPGEFANVSDISGISGQTAKWVSFGTGFADFDGDGWQDLFFCNGHVEYAGHSGPYFQPAQLYRNQEGERFIDVSDQGGPYFSIPHAGRVGIVGDLDDDGGLDLVLVHQNDPVVLLHNRRPAAHWVRVKLVGTQSNRDAVGAKVSGKFAGRELVRWIRGAGGYLSHFDVRILLPARDESPLEITVKWPMGLVERFPQVPGQATHVLVEGQGEAVPSPTG